MFYTGFVMKVLEKGREQKGWSKEYHCSGGGNGLGGCNAKLLVEEGDLFKTSSSDYTGHTDHYTTFQCSECQVLTDIPDSDYRGWRDLPTRRMRSGKVVNDNY